MIPSLTVNQSQYNNYLKAVQVTPREKYKTLVRAFFKDEFGNPFEMSDGQADIFRYIFEPQYTRVVIRSITQYGKSDVTSEAILSILADRPEKILVIAPSGKQSEIIMKNVIRHLFDNVLITDQVDIKDLTALERLKLERSKDRLTFRKGGEVFILTANADEMTRQGKDLMGFGATVVIVDESSLIPDGIFSKILRMVGSAIPGRVEPRKLVQLGNPFEQNHFYKAFNNPRYQQLIIGKDQALKEGRITQEFLDEAREDMTELEYKIFYDCEFPMGGAEDSLIPWEWIDRAVDQNIPIGDYKQIGLDVARFGRDSSIYAKREGGKLTRLKEFEKMDTMQLVGWSSRLFDEDGPDIIGVDAIGIGSGVADRQVELGYPVVAVNVGEGSDDENTKKRYINKRAEYYFHLRDQFEPDSKTGISRISIPNDAELIKQLKELRYKIASDKRIKIEEKEEMKKRLGGMSPDKADAVMLAYAPLEDNRVSMTIL